VHTGVRRLPNEGVAWWETLNSTHSLHVWAEDAYQH